MQFSQPTNQPTKKKKKKREHYHSRGKLYWNSSGHPLPAKVAQLPSPTQRNADWGFYFFSVFLFSFPFNTVFPLLLFAETRNVQTRSLVWEILWEIPGLQDQLNEGPGPTDHLQFVVCTWLGSQGNCQHLLGFSPHCHLSGIHPPVLFSSTFLLSSLVFTANNLPFFSQQ